MNEQLKGEEATSAPDELEQAVVLIRREPGKRELYLEALAAAGSEGADPISRFDLEGRMAAKPQAATMFQSMGTLIDALVHEGLLARIRSRHRRAARGHGARHVHANRQGRQGA